MRPASSSPICSQHVQSTPDVTPLACHLALLGLFLPAAQDSQQTPIQPPAPRSTLNHTLVFLDPAHGGDDAGAHLVSPAGEPILEKDITLALAGRLRSQLSALGLTVLSTRDTEAPAAGADSPTAASPAATVPTPDQRAGLANHVRPFACIVLHATATGTGVHLITSALPLPQTPGSPPNPLPWDAAQASFLQQSDRLAAEISTAIARTGIPAHTSHATIRPLDSLTCPAVLIELAPSRGVSASDPGYQARVAQSVATALLFWRGHAEAEPTAASDPNASAQP